MGVDWLVSESIRDGVRRAGTHLRITTVPELTPHKFSVMSWYVNDVRGHPS
jgi:hypothetical protein